MRSAAAEPPHTIASSLAIHHLDGGKKRTLFRDLAAALALDGDLRAFAEFQRLYVRDPDGDPIDKPSSLAEQLAWPAEAGFAGVDAHWPVAWQAIFSGRKA